MGVSHVSAVPSLSVHGSLFECGSCKFRLQRDVPHSYLCVKAALAGLAWFSLVFKLIHRQSYYPGAKVDFFYQAIQKLVKKKHSWMICLCQSLKFPIGTGTCLKILLYEVKGCMGAANRGSLWLFVPVSHQSASVKASTAGVLTSTLWVLPPPSAWLFYSPLFVYMLNTLLISSVSWCVHSKRMLNCFCLNVSGQ